MSNADKLAYIDIGELGWSLYLSAHIRWLKNNTNSSVAIITYPARRCLYEELADIIIDVPEDFYKLFDIKDQNCFGLFNVSYEHLKSFFMFHVPLGYRIPSDFILTCRWFFGDRVEYAPYPYSKKLEGRKEIFVFPRCRRSKKVHIRNLPEQFYSELVKLLCSEFPNITVRTLGTLGGAYDIKSDKSNYINWIGKTKTIQELVDLFQVARVTVGSQSAPPKLALLQNIPTFMIGHQRERHIKNENWMGTKVGFFKIEFEDYEDFDNPKCLDEIVRFIKEIE